MLQDEARYLALSADRTKFVPMDSTFNPLQCLQGPTLICPTVTTILANPEENCLFHLISGKDAEHTKCQLSEVLEDRPYLQSIDAEHWAYSGIAPIIARPSCLDLTRDKTPTLRHPDIILQGDLMLNIPRSCSLDIGTQQIPTRLIVTTDIGFSNGRLVLPHLDVHAILNLHGKTLFDDKIQKEFTNAFKSILELKSSAVLNNNLTSQEVHKIIQQLLGETQAFENIQPHMTYHYINWSTLIFLFIVLSLLALWFYKRPRIIQELLPRTDIRQSSTLRDLDSDLTRHT